MHLRNLGAQSRPSLTKTKMMVISLRVRNVNLLQRMGFRGSPKRPRRIRSTRKISR